MTYFHLQLSNVVRSEEDWLSQFCFDQGAAGVSENLDFIQTLDHYEPKTIEKEIKTLDVYFASRPSEDFFIQIQSKFPHITLELKEEENKDWLEEWKKGFNSFRLAGPYWILPSWLERPAEAEIVIKIDPGMAFGTGTHETTQIAAELINQQEAKSNFSAIDVGTGTAVLAMLCRLKGVGYVVGTDIDEQARRVARENLALNEMKSIEILEEQIDSLQGVYDWVIANIIDGVLIQIQNDLKRLVKPGGLLFLTGILLERESYFLDQFILPSEFKIIKRLAKGEWLGFVVQREEG